MPGQHSWIIVANSAKAKIYRVVHFPKVEELTIIEHPESLLHDSELVSSKPGRNFDSSGTIRHAYEPKSDPKELEAEKFARYLGHYLSKACQHGEFSRLYIMAGPHFLGLLRHELDKKTQETVIGEIAKDLTEHTASDVEEHLSKL